MPDARGKSIFQRNDSIVGNGDIGKIPNITGNFGGYGKVEQTNGAFAQTQFLGALSGTSAGGGGVVYSFDASRSSSMYSDADRVIPAGIHIKFVIKY